jgi:thymidylate kinase
MNEDADFPEGALDLVRQLAQRLESAGVRYCQWKSTTGLPKAVAGQTDLDLLVHRDDATRFTNAVAEIGFKEFISHPSRRFPSVHDYLGFDERSGRLVHLHVYYRLIVGEHYVKNHILPLEDAFLASPGVRHGIRVPPPAAELFVLVVRALLQYRDRDAIKDLIKWRRMGIPSGFQAEAADLARRTSDRELAAFVTRHMPSVRGDEIARFVDILRANPRDARSLLALRRSVRRGLRAFERMPPHVARARYFGAHLERTRYVRPLLDRIGTRGMRRKSSAAGGLTVALVGADGAGKSTLTVELRDWLAWRVNFDALYLGTNQPSRRTAAAQTLSRVLRRASHRAPSQTKVGTGVRYAADLIASVRYLAEARDRVARARFGWRVAANGGVVVFDRYPLPIVRLDNGRPVDGARIGEIAAGRSGLFELLRRREASEYRRLPIPDLTILLHVPPEVAVSRKPGDKAANVAAKARAVIAGASQDFPNMVVIDATCPLPEVAAAVKREVWRRL